MDQVTGLILNLFHETLKHDDVKKMSVVSGVECWADYNKRVIPIIIGAVVVGLILIAALTYLFIRDQRRQGYDSL